MKGKRLKAKGTKHYTFDQVPFHLKNLLPFAFNLSPNYHPTMCITLIKMAMTYASNTTVFTTSSQFISGSLNFFLPQAISRKRKEITIITGKISCQE
ncbi:MAG TPA: hypothetical protein VNX40_14255 [Mucilaginibacter sp.]|nr:hypothetical protein [Mucilaginibacter sp.]